MASTTKVKCLCGRAEDGDLEQIALNRFWKHTREGCCESMQARKPKDQLYVATDNP